MNASVQKTGLFFVLFFILTLCSPPWSPLVSWLKVLALAPYHNPCRYRGQASVYVSLIFSSIIFFAYLLGI